MLPLMSRPQSRVIDFETSRFVVGADCGLSTDQGRLPYGAEVPAGILSAEALRQVYEPPLRRIELFEYAAKIPDLVEACASHGISIEELTGSSEPPVKSPEIPVTTSAAIVVAPPDFDKMTKTELTAWCEERDIPTHGTIDKIRKRIAHYLVG